MSIRSARNIESNSCYISCRHMTTKSGEISVNLSDAFLKYLRWFGLVWLAQTNVSTVNTHFFKYIHLDPEMTKKGLKVQVYNYKPKITQNLDILMGDDSAPSPMSVRPIWCYIAHDTNISNPEVSYLWRHSHHYFFHFLLLGIVAT